MLRFESATERSRWVHTAPLARNLRDFLVAMSSPPVLQFLEALTGIEGLIPDPYYGGAGPHQIVSGGFLKIHADFNWHPLLRLDRRLNLLVYLNKDWPEEYGGHLELWDREMKGCERRVLPLFNRTCGVSTTAPRTTPSAAALLPARSDPQFGVVYYYPTGGRKRSARRRTTPSSARPTSRSGRRYGARGRAGAIALRAGSRRSAAGARFRS